MDRTQVRRASAAVAILLSGAVALIVLLGSAGVSSAAGLLQAATAADTRAAAGKGPSFDNLTARSRIVRINSAELSRHVAPLGADTAADRISRASRLDGIIRIELFPDVVATFHRKAIEAAGDSGFAWTGDIDRNPLYYATLIIEDGEVTGHIQLLDRLFRIDPIGGGLHRVTELIPSRFGEELVEPVKPSRSGSAPRGGLGETRGKSTITVLIGYTAAAKQQDPNIKRTIKQAVALANVGYANTGVPIRLVVADIVSAGDYAEAEGAGSQAFSTDLHNLNGDSGDVLNKLRKAQRRLGADLVSLFRKPSPDNICGIAGLVDTPTHATNDVSYSVVSRTCVSNLSLHHELGHNMGLRHDSFVDPTPGVGYNHGYVNTLAACRVRTVMGYNNQCSPNFCTRINAFSTPAFTVKVGSTNCQIGSASSADNTRRLIENRKIISKYRRERDTSAGIPMADVR